MSTKSSKQGGRKVSSASNDGEPAFKLLHPISKRQSTVIQTTTFEFEHFPFQVFILLEEFLNVCFFLLLVPFRIRKHSQGLYVREKNRIQQILSTLVVVLIILYFILHSRRLFEHNLKQKPETSFQYVTGLLYHIIPICWIVTFWLRAHRFDDLLSICQYHSLQQNQQPHFISQNANMTSKYPGWKHVWFLKITIFISFAKFVTNVYYLCNPSLEKHIDNVVGEFLYNLYIRDDNSIETEERLNSPLLNSAAYALQPMIAYVLLIECMFEQFCLTGAVIVYAACDNLSDTFESLRISSNASPSASQTRRVIKRIAACYLDLVSRVDFINNIFGPSILLFFVHLYPILIWNMFDRNYDGTVLEIVIRVWDAASLLLVVAIAAAANGKLSELKQWLFYVSMTDLSLHQEPTLERLSSRNESVTLEKEADDPVLSQDEKSEVRFLLTTMQREMSTEVIGLKGCSFFTVTYNFILTMVGILITYAIVMLQLTMDPKKNDTENACNSTINQTRTADDLTMETDYRQFINIAAEVCLKTYCNNGNYSSSFITE